MGTTASSDGSVDEEFCPRILRVRTPGGYSMFAGIYQMTSDSAANGMPVWQQMGGDCHLYGGRQGNWLIGDEAADVEADRGAIRLCNHEGRMPHRCKRAWERWVGQGDWHLDEAITVNADSTMEEMPKLQVNVPGGPSECAGCYEAETGCMVNGMPMWRQCGGECHLYGSRSGHWLLGRSRVDMEEDLGSLLLRDHCGLPPHEASGAWERALGEGQWQQDAAAAVILAPGPEVLAPTLHVCVPSGPSEHAGDYALKPSMWANGMPMWQQMGGDSYIYADRHGRWAIGEFDWEAIHGALILPDHRGMMPHEARGTWQCMFDEDRSHDPGVAVGVGSQASMAAQELWVRLPSGPGHCAGKYELESGWIMHGMPVWRQADGDCRLFGDRNGHWVVGLTGSDVNIGRGILVLTDHRGRMPQHTCGIWEKAIGDEQWLPDPDIRVCDLTASGEAADPDFDNPLSPRSPRDYCSGVSPCGTQRGACGQEASGDGGHGGRGEFCFCR